MNRTPLTRHALGLAMIASLVAVVATCGGSTVDPPGDHIALGTWGGDNTGMIVSDSGAHVHIGCTYGDVLGIVPLDATGKYDIAGSYLLRAYPIAVGPSMPAQFTGTVSNGRLTLIVAVNDTVEHKITILGPVTLQYGKTPQMGPCPICRSPAFRLR
jgi:hypothetical protein